MSFSADVSRIAEKTGIEAEQIARGVFITLFSDIIADTPVLTGRLRGEWQTTKSTPAQSEAGRFQIAKTGEATQEVHSTIDKPGLYYLTNLMPYAYAIEFDGRSDKSPEGMVRRNVLRIHSILKGQGK